MGDFDTASFYKGYTPYQRAVMATGFEMSRKYMKFAEAKQNEKSAQEMGDEQWAENTYPIDLDATEPEEEPKTEVQKLP